MLYQEIGGVRQAVAGQYVLEGTARSASRWAPMTTAQPLVIDPILSYSTYLGGGGLRPSGNGIAVDPAGNVYVTGYTNSTNFPTTDRRLSGDLRRRQRRLRDQAERDGHGPGLLHLPRRHARRRRRPTASPWTPPATPT